MRSKTRRKRELHQPETLVPRYGPVDAVQLGPLPLIDDALRRCTSRRLVRSNEIVDLLLDLRSAVALDATFAVLLGELEMR